MHSIQENNKLAKTEQANLQVEHLHIETEMGQVLVEDLSFDLYNGQTLAIVGESGSGKSLTGLALMGLLPQNLVVAGQVSLSQQAILSMSETEKRKIRGHKIAMIFQEPMTALNPLHKVEKIVGETLILQGKTKKQVKKRVIELLQDVGIQDPINKLKCYPHELSGGQRQRVMIAMALAMDPEILIADEPTTALDVTLQIQILDLLKQLQKERQMSMILISHDLNLVRRYAEQVIVMKKGQLVESGNIEQVFFHPQSEYTRFLLDQDFGEPIELISGKTILELNAVSVKFPIKTGILNRVKDYFVAVNPLSFTVKQGESLGIVGESGSGKSSLALAIVRLIESSGEINFLGKDLNKMNDKGIRSFRKDIQIVFQDPFSSLNPRMRIEQIIAEGLRLKNMPLVEKTRLVEESLIKVELMPDLKNRYPHELSGGQRQRVSLARSLILNPKLIVLDEPTSALDRSTQKSIINLLRRLQQNDQMSYIFISHDLHVVKALCQNVLVLRNADLIEYQNTKNIFSHPNSEYTKKLIEASDY
nr:dipeptide ABC transporter ATP-binding protein [Acinetobacter sp. Marseille-Q1620]